jgi:hypothetical protein
MICTASFEAFTVVMFQVEIFRVVMLCSVVVGYQCSGGPCCLHLHPEMLMSYHNTTLCHDPEDINLKDDFVFYLNTT